jgi:hypothetical protein
MTARSIVDLHARTGPRILPSVSGRRDWRLDVEFITAQSIRVGEFTRSDLGRTHNLCIHGKASLYEAFPAAEARRLVGRFEWRYAPKHGSWLNLAESELALLSPSVSPAASPTNKSLSRKSPPGSTTTTPITPRPIGASQPQTPHQTQAPIPVNLTESGD